MRIAFFNRFFFPDTSATSQLLSDLAFYLASVGHEVCVVTTAVRGAPRGVATIRGVEVHRVANPAHAPGGLAGRAISYLAYHHGARRAARNIIAPGDVVVIETDPPMLGASIGPIARRRGATVVNWLQDLFPEVAERHGIPMMRGPLGRALRRARDRSLLAADRNVAIGDLMARHLRESLGEEARIDVIHNWANGTLISPLDPDRNPLRHQWGFDGRFVVGYSGNLGRVHEFETLLEAARELRADPAIRFLIVGRGPRLDEVKRRVSALRLDNVRFEPHQDRDRLQQSLCVPDVHVVALAPEYEGLVQPSKLYGVMAAGRATLFIGDPHGESATILSKAEAGIAVPSGDSAALAAAIRGLAADPDRAQRMGAAARVAFDARYGLPVALALWEGLLNRVSK